MPISLYKKIIHDCQEFPEPIKKMKIGTFGEPLLNKNIAEMVRIANDSINIEFTQILTNGILLTKSLSEALLDAGLNRIEFSIEALSSQGYKIVTGRDVDFDKLINEISYFYERAKGRCVVYCKIVDKGLAKGESEDYFYGMFEKICDEMAVEKTLNLFRGSDSDDWVGETNKLGMYGQQISLKKQVCTFIFTKLLINSNGEAVLCCSDWRRDEIIGNASRESLYNIWNGEKLRAIQKKHLNFRRNDIPICRGCNFFREGTVDDIDAYADEILARYNNEMG
jgi:radical SAM protein with 4Fe4S-binding SPASM domain